jgi:hypothetical protein
MVAPKSPSLLPGSIHPHPHVGIDSDSGMEEVLISVFSVNAQIGELLREFDANFEKS